MTRELIRRFGIGAALVLAGGAALLGSEQIGPGPPASVDGTDRPLNTGAGDLGDISAHNSPTVVSNPRDSDQLAVTSRIDSPDFSCALHVSADGGRRWSRTRVPIPDGEGRKCYAPDAAFAQNGTLHVSYVTLRGVANQPQAVWVTSSRDGGRTLSEPRKVAGPLAFQVRIAADPEDPHRLYVTWVQARDIGSLKFTAPGNPVLITRSDDGGASWNRPARVNDARRGRVLAPSTDFGPDGEVYVLYLDVKGDRLDYEGGHEGFAGPPYPGRFALVLARSRDGGATWAESVVDDRIVPIGRFIAFLPPSPSLAVDRDSGRIYVGFHDARLGAPDVWVWSLEPGDREWGEPVRVNDTARPGRTSQYLPELAVAPGGRLDVVYYDRRGDPSDIRNQVSLQSSEDGARSFGARVTLTSRSFDSRIGFGSERGLPDLGSRLGLAAGEDGALAVWSDTRSGTVASGKQDLALVAVAPKPGAGRILLLGAAALTLAGLLWLWRASARRPAMSGNR